MTTGSIVTRSERLRKVSLASHRRARLDCRHKLWLRREQHSCVCEGEEDLPHLAVAIEHFREDPQHPEQPTEHEARVRAAEEHGHVVQRRRPVGRPNAARADEGDGESGPGHGGHHTLLEVQGLRMDIRASPNDEDQATEGRRVVRLHGHGALPHVPEGEDQPRDRDAEGHPGVVQRAVALAGEADVGGLRVRLGQIQHQSLAHSRRDGSAGGRATVDPLAPPGSRQGNAQNYAQGNEANGGWLLYTLIRDRMTTCEVLACACAHASVLDGNDLKTLYKIKVYKETQHRKANVKLWSWLKHVYARLSFQTTEVD